MCGGEGAEVAYGSEVKLVLDLSALLASTFADFQLLCGRHSIWIPEALFFEVLTKDKAEDRAKCFALIQSVNSKYTLIPNVGAMMGMEAKRGSEVQPELEAYEGITWINDKRLQDSDFSLRELEPNLISPWRAEIDRNIRSFGGVIQDVAIDFPELEGFRGGASLAQFEPQMQRVAQSDELVARVLAAISDFTFASTSVHFRSIRFAFINAIEHIRKYGCLPSQDIQKNVENSYLDSDYMVIASFADGLISNDNRLRYLYKLVCPHLLSFSSTKEVNSLETLVVDGQERLSQS